MNRSLSNSERMMCRAGSASAARRLVVALILSTSCSSLAQASLGYIGRQTYSGCSGCPGGESGVQCSNALDDDGDGAVNGGCAAVATREDGQECANAVDDDGDGAVNDGCPPFDSVVVFDTETNAVVHTIALNPTDAEYYDPRGIAASPDGKRVYVSGDSPSGPITVIDTATNAVITTIHVGSQLKRIAVTPDGCYVVATGTRFIEVIDAATNTDLGSVDTSALPSAFPVFHAIAMHPAMSRAYLPMAGSNDALLVLDTSTYGFVGPPVPLFDSYSGNGSPVVVNAAGTRVYVGDGSSASLAVIDAASNALMTSIEGFSGAFGGVRAIAVTPDDSRVYAAHWETLYPIDAATNAVLDPVTLPGASVIGELAFNANGARLYAMDIEESANRIFVVDPATDSVLSTIDVPASDALKSMAIAPPRIDLPPCGSVTTTTITPGESTTTTTPGGPGGCSVAVTHDGLRCRLQAIAAELEARGTPGKSLKRTLSTMAKVTAALQRAADALTAGKPPKAGKQLKKGSTLAKKLAKKLGSPKAGPKLVSDDAARSALVEALAAVSADLLASRATL